MGSPLQLIQITKYQRETTQFLLNLDKIPLKKLGLLMLRFTPSLAGDMHIGNLRVALLNYIVAKQLQEELIIRIEDIKPTPETEGKDTSVIALLDLFQIKYKEVLYQSKSIRFHQTMAFDLLNRKKAFNCFCTDESLKKKKEAAHAANQPYFYDGTCEELPAEVVIDNLNPFRVRMKKPTSPICFEDKIKGKLEYTPEEVDSFVILDVDKLPTYNFACAVDDMLQDISFVVRNEDHLDDTPKQIHVREALGYTKEIVYAHLPLILNSDGKKMTQDDKYASVTALLEEGFLPEAISNYLILIGYKDAPCEVFTVEEALEWFDITHLAKTPSKFDIERLRRINKAHLKRLDDKELSRYVGFADAEIGKLAKLYLEEASTTKELKAKVAPLFEKKEIPESLQEDAQKLCRVIQEAPYFDEYEAFKTYIIETSGLDEKRFIKPLRYLLTGSQQGPEVKDIYNAIKNYIKKVVQC